MTRKWKKVTPVYTEEDRSRIAERVTDILAYNPGIGETEARVYEVVSRMTGDNGLSDNAARYLTGCIMELLEGKS